MSKQELNKDKELAPCPFCGSEPVFLEASEWCGTWYEAGCEDCGIPTISLQIVDFFGDRRDELHSSWNDEEKRYGDEFINIVRNKAIEYWNNRVNNEQD